MAHNDIMLVALRPGVGVGDYPDCSISQLCKPPLAEHGL